MFILPFVMSRNLFYAGINAKVFLLAGLVCCLLIVLAWRLFNKKPVSLNIKKGWLLYSLMATLTLHLVSAFSGVYFWRSVFSDIIRSDGVLFLTMIGLLAFCLRSMATARDWSFIRRSIVISAGLFALLTYLGPGGFGLTGRFITANFSISGLTFANDTFAGAYVLLSILVTIIEISKSWTNVSDKKRKFVYIASFLAQCFSPLFINLGALFSGAVFTTPTALIGSARASAVTLFLVLVNLAGFFIIKKFFKDGTNNKALLAWSAVWLVGFFAVTVALVVPGSFVQKFYLNEESSLARPVVWERAIESIKERPLLGWGPENFQFAFSRHFDNRLYLDRGGREIWFDKAHNFTIDTLVEVGIVGLVSLFVLILFFIRTITRARRLNLISDFECYVLSLLVFAHIFQIQTSFDTVSTYVLIGIILGYGVWLENRILSLEPKTQKSVSSNSSLFDIVAGSVAIVILFGLSFVYVKEYSRQIALVDIFRTTKIESQDKLTERALSRVSDFESLRLSSASLIKGGLAQVSASNSDPKTTAVVLAQVSKQEKYFVEYLKEMPTDYRARMNYAYILLIKTTMGQNRIADAKSIISESYVLSPGNPLTYALDAVADLYSGNLKAAKAKTQEMLVLNPDAEFSKEIIKYVNFQEKQFPSVTVLKLENL